MPRTNNETVRICHLSDIHLPLPRTRNRLPWLRLIGKRTLGYANYALNRRRFHSLDPFLALVEHLSRENYDLLVITGDLANLSFDFEFLEADRLLRDYGVHPDKTVIIPGNHDRYTFDADLLSAFEKGMKRWLPPDFSRINGFPIFKAVGPVALFALDTAVWRNPIRAAGRVDNEQLIRMATLLSSTEARGRWPVIAMHHPPFKLAGRLFKHYRAGLAGYERLDETLAGRPATVLHGHLHRFSRRLFGHLETIGVPSASKDSGDEETQLAYHIYTFNRQGLVRAEAVRHWPAATGNSNRFSRVELPPAILTQPTPIGGL